ncbi:MAG: hypothetical protein ACFFAS_15630 [Promethearchaeota archaeon]
MERKIKGTLFRLVAKGIKSDKAHQQEYDKLLSEEAKDFLNQRILNSVWYSWDLYSELFKTLIKVNAKDNREIVRKWGADFGEGVMAVIYKNIIAEGNVKKLSQMYPRFHGLIYNFGTLTVDIISDNEMLFTYRNLDPRFELWYYSLIGWTQRVLEMCIKKKVYFEFLKKPWQGDELTQFKLYWSL